MWFLHPIPESLFDDEDRFYISAGSAIATAAKVAAEVAPDVVTGGIVAEVGPRPDFSLWTVEDDLLLKNAIEVRVFLSTVS